MQDSDTVKWKFPEAWLTLTKSDLGQVVSAGATYVQEAFNWEADKTDEINNCTSLEELDVVDLGDPTLVQPQIDGIN